MAQRILKTGKKTRPKTAIAGKRYRCAVCHKRSPTAIKAPAPWYCPKCPSGGQRRQSRKNELS